MGDITRGSSRIVSRVREGLRLVELLEAIVLFDIKEEVNQTGSLEKRRRLRKEIPGGNHVGA